MIYSNLDSTAQETLALNQLYNMVTMEMKCRCMDKECRNVFDAVDVFERYESLFEETEERKGIGVRAVNVVPLQNEVGIPYDELCEDIDQIFQRLTILERATSTARKITCFNCSSPSAFIRDCPVQRSWEGAATPTAQGNGRPSTF